MKTRSRTAMVETVRKAADWQEDLEAGNTQRLKTRGWLGDKSEAASRLEDNTSGVKLSSNISKKSGQLANKADSAARLEDETIYGQFCSNLSTLNFRFCLFTFVLIASLLAELIMTIASSG